MFSDTVKSLVWPAMAAVSAAAAYWCCQLPARRIGLEVRPASGDEVRIAWNRASSAALLAASGTVLIRDGAAVHRTLLNGEQLRQGSMFYRRETGKVRVSLKMESRIRWAGLSPESDFASFNGAAPPPREPTPFEIVAAALRSATEFTLMEPARDAVPEPAANSADRAMTPRRMALIPESLPVASPPADPFPAAPALAMMRPAAAGPPLVVGLPLATLPPPGQPAYSGPRSGQIIWTGSIRRRGVVEIEGAHASVGSTTGVLPGVPVVVRVSPAEFSSRGLVVHTADVSSDGRVETASGANGWNATLFQWEPARAHEVVLLEAPNPSNDFKRLAVRSDARTCAVMLVEWTVR